MCTNKITVKEYTATTPTVIKRDGVVVSFDKGKIEQAILQAANEKNNGTRLTVDQMKMAADIALKIYEELGSTAKEAINVEEIQDMVIKYLTEMDGELAQLYEAYRSERTRVRESKSSIIDYGMNILKKGDTSNQNGNVDGYSFGGRVGAIADRIMTEIALEKLVSPTTKYNHNNNISYIHDKSHYPIGDPNCINATLDYILSHGFSVKQTDIRPAKSASTALQLIVVWFQLHSLGQFGGIGATHIDHTLVPYIRMSFLKHYITAWIFNHPELLKDEHGFNLDLIALDSETYEEKLPSGLYIVRSKLEDLIDEMKEKFYEMTGLKEEDFRFDNKENLDPEYFNKAYYLTSKEVAQGVEGLFHNLNVLGRPNSNIRNIAI